MNLQLKTPTKRKISKVSETTYNVVPIKKQLLSPDERIDEASIVEAYKANKQLTEQQLKMCAYFTFESYPCSTTLPNYKYLDRKFAFKTEMLMSLLNPEQLNVFNSWHKLLEAPFLYCLDAPAGTGKTFLIRIFLMTCTHPIIFCSFRHDLVTDLRIL